MINWPLMDNAIPKDQRVALSNFILDGDKFSQGQYVKEFEEEWSKWQGCKYSVFVNSGSSANFLAVHALNNYDETKGWVSQACTWSTTVSPIILSKNKLNLCDVNLPNLDPDLHTLEYIFNLNKPKYLFLAHLLGFCALSQELLDLCKKYNVELLEDCCESHGTTYDGVKIGNFGKVSTFSFYYGHHMTTIEGGMVCTNDKDIYEKLLLLRSHGLLRELPEESQQKYKKVNKNFTFITPGFNVRSCELNAYLGLLQLKNLDKHNKIRQDNFNHFAKNLDNKKYFNNFKVEGNSSFCFPIITKNKDQKDILLEKLTKEGIETRPVIAGNLYNHPFIDGVVDKIMNVDDKANYVHENGFYVGNNHNISITEVDWLLNLLNE
mgnify:CR=1 FL=1